MECLTPTLIHFFDDEPVVNVFCNTGCMSCNIFGNSL